jgi:hypothetical protein
MKPLPTHLRTIPLKGQTALTMAFIGEARPKLFASVPDIPSGGISFYAQRYPYVGAPLCLDLYQGTGPYTTLTAQYERDFDVTLDGDEILVKAYSENEPIRAHMLASGYFKDSQKRQPLPFGELEVWKLTPKFVNEFAATHKVAVVDAIGA